MLRTLDLSSKEAYLRWVKEWKEEYKQVSQELRELRILLSQPHELKIVNGYTFSAVAGKQWERMGRKSYATTLLEIRKNGKELSWKIKQGELTTNDV